MVRVPVQRRPAPRAFLCACHEPTKASDCTAAARARRDCKSHCYCCCCFRHTHASPLVCCCLLLTDRARTQQALDPSLTVLRPMTRSIVDFSLSLGADSVATPFHNTCGGPKEPALLFALPRADPCIQPPSIPSCKKSMRRHRLWGWWGQCGRLRRRLTAAPFSRSCVDRPAGSGSLQRPHPSAHSQPSSWEEAEGKPFPHPSRFQASFFLAVSSFLSVACLSMRKISSRTSPIREMADEIATAGRFEITLTVHAFQASDSAFNSLHRPSQIFRLPGPAVSADAFGYTACPGVPALFFGVSELFPRSSVRPTPSLTVCLMGRRARCHRLIV